MKRKSKISLW